MVVGGVTSSKRCLVVVGGQWWLIVIVGRLQMMGDDVWQATMVNSWDGRVNNGEECLVVQISDQW